MRDKLDSLGFAIVELGLYNYSMVKFCNGTVSTAPKKWSLEPIKFLKDTGASQTTISYASLLDLGYPLAEIKRLARPTDRFAQLAAGRVKTAKIFIPLFSVAEREFKSLSFLIIHPDEYRKPNPSIGDEGLDFGNLFGMDYARYFNYREMVEAWEFELTPAEPLHKLSLSPEQSIGALGVKNTDKIQSMPSQKPTATDKLALRDAFRAFSKTSAPKRSDKTIQTAVKPQKRTEAAHSPTDIVCANIAKL